MNQDVWCERLNAKKILRNSDAFNTHQSAEFSAVSKFRKSNKNFDCRQCFLYFRNRHGRKFRRRLHEMIEKTDFAENYKMIYDHFEVYVLESSQRSHHQIFNLTKKTSFVRKITSQQNCQTVFQLLSIWTFRKSMFCRQKMRSMRKREARKKRLFDFKNSFKMCSLRKFTWNSSQKLLNQNRQNQ